MAANYSQTLVTCPEENVCFPGCWSGPLGTFWALQTHAECYRNILLNKKNQVRFNYKLRVRAHVHRLLNNNSLHVHLVCFLAYFSEKPAHSSMTAINSSSSKTSLIQQHT